MPKRSKKSNQGCCLVSLVIWPFQVLENLINSIFNPPSAPRTPNSRRTSSSGSTSKTSGTTDRFVDVTPASRQKASAPSFGITISYEDHFTKFVKEAQRLRSREEKTANRVAFQCYWPTYSVMSAEQQRWYFYWRTQARQGTYLPTDLSYIFVHVYEILNLVEVSNPVQAAERLRILWMHYRETYPNLDKYLADWGGDLLAVKSSGEHALAWWENLLGVDGLEIPDPVINTIVEKAIRTNGLDKLPYRIWALLSEYQPRNKFYQRYNVDHFVDHAYEKAIQVANSYYLQTSNQSLIDLYVPNRVQNYEKPVFASAVIGYSYPRVIRLASGRDYAGSPRLATSITSIMKYAENLLRKQLKFSAKLSGVELPADLAKQLDLAFVAASPAPAKPEPIRITLDPRRVATLQQESQAVSEMLDTDKTNGAKALLTDLKEVRSLWAQMSNFERLAIADLLDRKWDTSFQFGQTYGVATEQVQSALGAINQKALQILGDKLIYESNTLLSLAEDFIDELEVVVKEIPPSYDLSVQQSENHSDPWEKLFDSLEPAQVELTKILAHTGQLDGAELDRLARTHNTMGNALMDALNEKAQAALNHLPFYPDGEYWLVEEDDLPTLRQHLGL
ncbi:MAG TPA: TerB N-terminal domain-containing protein [Anaerolineales bacterium]|nr:TerB N-terminal domain-containing protein [Anaerolineales bacterium]